MSPALRRKSFNPRDLVADDPADPFHDDREPEIGIGDVVQLNSGSPSMLVVDVGPQEVTVALDRGKTEYVFPRPCVHRIRDLW